MKENHHLKSFCKNFSRKTVTLSITVLLLFTLSFGALAASYTVYSNVTTTKVARLATKGDCGGVGGIAIGKNKNSMFCIKTNTGTDQEAKFYYIPDLDNVSSETTRITTIKGAGHANAMAIDGTYVYITCWMDAKGHENENKNQIMLIPRKVIASTANGGEIKAATDDTSGYKILTAKVKNTDASTKDTNPYVDYNKAIRSITLHKSNGKFIIGYDVGDDSKNYYYYTTAKLIIQYQRNTEK